MVAALLLLAQWLQLVDGASPIEAGVRLIPVALAAAVSSLVAPPLARVIGSRTVLVGGLALAGAGMLVVGLHPGEIDYAVILIAMVLIGAGTGSLAIASAMVMMGSPEERAGNAGALEETSYELGGTLGVAILGSISALVYRSALTDTADGIDPGTTAQAGESLGAAVAIAEEMGIPALARDAGAAFVDSLQTAGLVGGTVMLVVAAAVFALTPKGTDISGAAH